MSASGRVCEITNGRFVEAKHEKRWLAVRLLGERQDIAAILGDEFAAN